MYRYFKRIIDVIISLAGIVLLSPLLLVTFLALVFANRGKPLFLQKRTGKDGHAFTMIKFRTMNDLKDKDNNLLPDEDRLTSIGKLLRRTSIDELPQLFNVLSGKMSLVGPRPLLPEYLQYYNENQKHRHDIKPGITGWAQVRGRNSVTWDERFDLDLYYVRNASFKLDMKILWLTVINVINGSGVTTEENRTMDIFRGSRQ